MEFEIPAAAVTALSVPSPVGGQSTRPEEGREVGVDRFVIHGGKPLRGEVTVSGAKNAALPIMAATLLAPGRHLLRNVPALADVRTLARLLEHMGARVERGEGRRSHELSIAVPERIRPEAPYDLVKTMRASVVVLGPLLSRLGQARVSMPGGCAIGARPIDQHIRGLARLGAKIGLSHGNVEARARRLRGATVTFDVVTVTGTENLLMAAALARGRTVLENAAREPEVEDLARFLSRMGARVEGAGTDVITVDGVERLAPGEHTVIPDRIEAGTLLAAAALTRGEVTVRGLVPAHVDAVVHKLCEAGARIEPVEGGLRCTGPRTLRAVDVVTSPYPGFPTDMQAQMMALLAVARGSATVTETVFENRFMHVLELNRMGANIRVDGHSAFVRGIPDLSGAQVMATDLRASACLVLAGVRAAGATVVQRVYHLDRGYEALDRKLRELGADVRRTSA